MWGRKNRFKIQSLESDNLSLKKKCDLLEEDISYALELITDDMIELNDRKILLSRIRFLNVLYKIKIKKEIAETDSYVKSELDSLHDIIQDMIVSTEEKINRQKSAILSEIKEQEEYIAELESKKEKLENEIVTLEDEKLYQDFGLYTPVYDLMSSKQYKDRIKLCRDDQKHMVKNKTAAFCDVNWTVNNSIREGRKMINHNIKQVLRTFNNECDYLISKVKYNNIEAIKNKIKKSYDSLNNLNEVNCITISDKYLDLKISELQLCYEYEEKKQEEKEYARMIREQEREQAKLLKEIENERKKIKKEQEHYEIYVRQITEQLSIEQNQDRIKFLNEKLNNASEKLNDLDLALKDIDYREANQKAGYVYIASNIGSFGENVYKIGMTRRLNPQDRIDELGGASVPFKFDVHAMIFSEDAPALEASLHRAFDSKKVNMTNNRKEFFNVTLDEIKDVIIKNYDKSVTFTEIPSAQQYRESMKIRESIKQKTS